MIVQKEATDMTMKEFEKTIDKLFNDAIASIDEIWKDYNKLTKNGK